MGGTWRREILKDPSRGKKKKKKKTRCAGEAICPRCFRTGLCTVGCNCQWSRKSDSNGREPEDSHRLLQEEVIWKDTKNA